MRAAVRVTLGISFSRFRLQPGSRELQAGSPVALFSGEKTTLYQIVRTERCVLGVSPQAVDHVIRSLRRKGWLAERAGATIPVDVRTNLQDLAKGAGKSFFGPKIPKPGAIGYQASWQLTANVASQHLSDSARYRAATFG